MYRLSNQTWWTGLAAAIFLLTVVVFTWPLATNLTRLYPSLQSLDSNDASFFIWYMDSVAKAVTGDLAQPMGKMIYYPQGIDAWGSFDSPLALAIGVPLNLATKNPVLSYNLTLLAGFWFTAFAMYLLSRHLLPGSWWFALLGGLSFGFSSYMLTRGLAHLNLMFLGVIPILVLATLKFCQHPSKKKVLFLALSMLLAALSSWYYALSGLVFIAITFVYFWPTIRSSLRLSALAVCALGLALVIPAIPMLISENGGAMPMPEWYIRNSSLQPANLILPNPLSTLTGKLADPVFKNFPSNHGSGQPNYYEMTGFLGLLGILGVFSVVWRKRLGNGTEYWLWFSVLVVFVVLALGPSLTFAGHRVYLPFAALAKIYPFGLFRVPDRFFVVALLAATVLGLYSLDYFRRKLDSKRLVPLLGVLSFILILGLNLIAPYPLMNFPISSFYGNLAKDNGSYAIADLPVREYPVYDYYQTVHHKPIVGGYYFYPAMTDKIFSFIRSNPLLSSGICEDTPASASLDLRSSLAGLKASNVRYVVVHNITLKNAAPYCDQAERNIRQYFRGVKPYYADGDITVYLVE